MEQHRHHQSHTAVALSHGVGVVDGGSCVVVVVDGGVVVKNVGGRNENIRLGRVDERELKGREVK